MLARHRWRTGGDPGDGDEAADDPQRQQQQLKVPLHKRLFFFAKIDPDLAAEKVSKVKFPAAIGGLQDRLTTAYDEFTNPEFKPDRRRLASVEDFFRYTEEEGALRIFTGPPPSHQP